MPYHLRRRRGIEGFQLRKKLLLFKTYGNCCWFTAHLTLVESQRERSSHATSDTSCHFTLSRGEPHRKVLNGPLVAEKGLLWEGGRESGRKGKTRKGGQTLYTPFSLYVPSLSHYTPFLASQSVLKASAPNLSQNA